MFVLIASLDHKVEVLVVRKQEEWAGVAYSYNSAEQQDFDIGEYIPEGPD